MQFYEDFSEKLDEFQKKQNKYQKICVAGDGTNCNFTHDFGFKLNKNKES